MMIYDPEYLFDLIGQLGLTLEAEHLGPHHDPGLSYPLDAWDVTLRRGDAEMTVRWHQGTFFAGETPALDVVVWTLVEDAATWLACNSFEDWCGEYGYDPEHPNVSNLHEQATKQATDIIDLLGDDWERFAQ